jgi:ABC-type branched-subunit amino acid transport system substrate-binding protein/predicted Ser/Thr protein kinase
MTENLVGKQLGKYKIDAILGKGGMGMVYRGYDPLLDRKVAIKVLAPHLVWEEGFVERFLREARAAARIKHPNIVTVYDVGQEQDQFYFVMEYLEGQTLGEYIRQRGALPPKEVLAIMRPLADALDYAHHHGLVHRDIKPGNIMIGSGQRVTLTDFGIARAAEETRLTSTGMIMGTPEYMSPEQAWGDEVGPQTDLYSLAVVAYEMLSGRVPFSGTTPHAVLYKQIHEPPPPLRDSRPELPVGLEAVLARALDKAPDKRYATAKDFVLELESALAGKLEVTPEEAPTELVASMLEVGAEEAPTELVVGKLEVASEEVPIKAVTGKPATPAPVVPPRKKAAARRRVPPMLWILGIVGVLAILAGVIGIVWFASGNGQEPTSMPSPQAAVEPTATRALAQPASTQPPAPPVVEEPPCDDPAGCVVIGPDVPILIGVMLPLSGDRRDLGVAALHGVELAVGRKRNILGHPIEVVAEDSICAEEGALRAAEALISNPGIVSIVGSSCPGTDYDPVRRLCAESMPLISPSGITPELTSPDRPEEFGCFLRTAAVEDMRPEAAAEFAWDSGVRRAATVQDEGILSDNMVQRFTRRFVELGGEIVAQERLGPDNPEVAPLLERLANSEAQLLYAPVYVERGAEIASLMREIPPLREVRLLGADGMFTPRYLGAAGEAAIGTLLSAPDIEVIGPGYFEFLLAYEEAFGEPPRAPLCAPAYDAAWMILSAIEDVARRLDEGTLIIGRRALLERLYATRGLNGVTGRLSCNPNGDCGKPSAAVYEIVSPDPANWHPGASPDNNPRKVWP